MEVVKRSILKEMPMPVLPTPEPQAQVSRAEGLIDFNPNLKEC